MCTSIDSVGEREKLQRYVCLCCIWQYWHCCLFTSMCSKANIPCEQVYCPLQAPNTSSRRQKAESSRAIERRLCAGLHLSHESLLVPERPTPPLPPAEHTQSPHALCNSLVRRFPNGIQIQPLSPRCMLHTISPLLSRPAQQRQSERQLLHRSLSHRATVG